MSAPPKSPISKPSSEGRALSRPRYPEISSASPCGGSGAIRKSKSGADSASPSEMEVEI